MCGIPEICFLSYNFVSFTDEIKVNLKKRPLGMYLNNKHIFLLSQSDSQH